MAVCEHGKRKDRCKDCGGSAVCEHNKTEKTIEIVELFY